MTAPRCSPRPDIADLNGPAVPLQPAGPWAPDLRTGLLTGLLAPGLLALVSLLLALLGSGAGTGPHARAQQASVAAPALPELRGVQAPLPQGPLLGTGEAAPLSAPRPQWRAEATVRSSAAAARRPELTVLGRRNTDGG